MAPPDVGAGRGGFYQAVSDAVADMLEYGYDGQERLDYWLDRIRQAAFATLTPASVVEQSVRDALTAVYRRQVERGAILKRHPGVERFTLEKLRPKLRAELDRRIVASANLIKLNRQAAIEKTLQRFQGWSTSIPPGGTEAQGQRENAVAIRKALRQLPYEERRVAIDQGHKFLANLSEIIAVDGGAIAAIWHSHWRQAGYDYREDHKERDGKVYAVRGSWAAERGLTTKCDGWIDDDERPGEAVFCRCYFQYLHNLRNVPSEFLTEHGRAELQRARDAIKARRAAA